MTYYDQNALKLCHAFWRERLRPGMTCVDATAGRGRDAEVLCRLIGETGHLRGLFAGCGRPGGRP